MTTKKESKVFFPHLGCYLGELVAELRDLGIHHARFGECELWLDYVSTDKDGGECEQSPGETV